MMLPTQTTIIKSIIVTANAHVNFKTCSGLGEYRKSKIAQIDYGTIMLTEISAIWHLYIDV